VTGARRHYDDVIGRGKLLQGYRPLS
jgi:hypothetical protein